MESFERDFVGSLIACCAGQRHDVIAELAAWFKPEYVLDSMYQDIYQAMMTLHESAAPVTSLSIRHTMKERGTWRDRMATELCGVILDYQGLWWHVRYYAAQVYERWRRLNAADETGTASRTLAEDGGDVDEVIGHLASMHNRYAPAPDKRAADNDDVYREIFEELENGAETDPNAVETGLDDLDRITGGFRPGSVTVVGARTSHGKSALLGHIAANLAVSHSRPCLFFSFEMTNKEIINRWARWVANDLKFTRSHLVSALGIVRAAPIQIFAGPRSIGQVESEVKAYARHKPELAAVFVDYLQQVRSDIRSDSREQAVADVSRRLKLLAMEIGKPIIVASQLSRAGLESDVPKLNHLRESGSIEQDADCVILMKPMGQPGEAVQPVTLAVAKNRNGAKGIVRVIWRAPIYRYESEAPERISTFDDYGGGAC